MLYTIPDHDAQLLHGAPLDDGPEPVQIQLTKEGPHHRITPVRRDTPDGTRWGWARDLVIQHLQIHGAQGWDADTIRRVVQVDLDADLDPEDFSTIAAAFKTEWEPGVFADEEALDSFEDQLGDILRAAGFTKEAQA